MKQKALSNIISAFDDKPKSIGDRLSELGLERDDFGSKFSKDLLGLQVYGSSFLKFLQEHAGVLDSDGEIAAEPLPTDFVNPFDDESMPIGVRLGELGLENKEAMFSEDVLDLKVTGDEFQDFIAANQAKFIGELGRLAEEQGGQNG